MERANEIAKFWGDILAMGTKKIEVLPFSIKPSTRKEPLGYVLLIKDGKFIEAEKGVEYDTIQIYVREFEEIKVPEIIEDLVYQGIILHELIHVAVLDKSALDKSEDEVKELTGQYLSGAYSFKTECVMCGEVLSSKTELVRHLEEVHEAKREPEET